MAAATADLTAVQVDDPGPSSVVLPVVGQPTDRSRPRPARPASSAPTRGALLPPRSCSPAAVSRRPARLVRRGQRVSRLSRLQSWPCGGKRSCSTSCRGGVRCRSACPACCTWRWSPVSSSGQHSVASVVAVQRPVLPRAARHFGAVEPSREVTPPPPPRRERNVSERRSERPRPSEVAPARVEEPAPQPVAADAGAGAGADGVAAATVATLPAISEPAPAPGLVGPRVPRSNGRATGLGPRRGREAPVAAPEGVTRPARPQGGYQVRPTYPTAPRRLGVRAPRSCACTCWRTDASATYSSRARPASPISTSAAIGAVPGWRFDAARRGNEPVSMWVCSPSIPTQVRNPGS